MSKKGKISRIINNNAIVSEAGGQEVIYMGSGLAYGKRNGDFFDLDKVEKTFVLEDNEKKDEFAELLRQISPEAVSCAASIIEHIEKQSDMKFGPMTFIALADHISFSLQRKREGIELPNRMLNEIRRFYPKEFGLGRMAVDVIRDRTGVYLDDNEAGFIAVHLINAVGDEDNPSGADQVKLINNIVKIIEEFFQIRLNEESIYYQRLITHLKFFAARVFDNKIDADGDDFFFRISRVQYPEVHKCVDLIEEYIDYNYQVKIGKEEKGYLIMHLSVLLKKKEFL